MAAVKKSKTSAKVERFYFLTGSDEAEVKKEAAAKAAKLAPGDDPFGMEIIDGAVSSADESAERIESAIQALLTVPFFGGKLVWLKNLACLGDSASGRAELVEVALGKLMELLGGGLPEGVTFLLSAPEPDKRRSVYKQLGKLGELELFDVPDLGFRATEADLVRWVADRAGERGVKLSTEAAGILASRVGLDTRQVDTELDKLELVRDADGKIDLVLLRQLVPETREGGIFDLSNALARRDLPGSLESLEQLLRQGESAVGILLAAIVPTVRNLLLVKDLMVRFKLKPPDAPQYFAAALNRLPEEALEHLPRKKDGALSTYALGLAAGNAAAFTLAELTQGLSACREANLSLVSGNVGPATVLTKLLVSLLGGKSAA